MTDILIWYNAYMASIFGDNVMLISAITMALIPALTYMGYVLPKYIERQVLKHLTTSLVLNSTHYAYHRIMEHLQTNDVVKMSRYLNILNGRWGHNQAEISIGAGHQFIKVLGTLMTVHVTEMKLNDHLMYTIEFRWLGRSHGIANRLLTISRTPSLEEGKITITRIVNGAIDIVRQKKEPFNKFIMSKDTEVGYKKLLRFTQSKEWYHDKNIPYKYGILLSGIPGGGKTKFIRTIAGELDYEVFLITTIEDFRAIPTDIERLMVVIEEIDTMIESREGSNEDVATDALSGIMKKMSEGTLSVLLQTLDGMIQTENRIVVVTTNYKNKLDKALLRPGRLDLSIELTYVTIEEFIRFYYMYYGMTMCPVSYKMNENYSGADIELGFRNGLTAEEFIKEFTTEVSS